MESAHNCSQSAFNGWQRTQTLTTGSTSPSTNRSPYCPSPRGVNREQQQLIIAKPRTESVPSLAKISQRLLDDNVKLKKLVVHCFRIAADGKELIDLTGLQTFKEEFAKDIMFPVSELFGDLETDFLRFDFTGDGLLGMNEVWKIVKYYLWEYRKQLGGQFASPKVVTKTLEQAGYRILKELGRGTQGVVYAAVNDENNEFCIKTMNKSKLCGDDLAAFIEEFDVLQLLACERIARAFEIFQDTGCYYMVGEIYKGGDLTTLKSRADRQGVVMDASWWRAIFIQCFQALEFMHQQAMMHCDIKEENIMLKTDDFQQPRIIIIDFGLCQASVLGQDKPCGTLGYIPPETFLKGKWYPSGDVFSMGVTLMQVIIGMPHIKVPGRGPKKRCIFTDGCTNLQDIAHATRTRIPPFSRVPTNLPHMSKLLQGLLEKDFLKRLKVPRVFDEEFMQGSLITRLEAHHEQRPANVRTTTKGITEELLATLMRTGSKNRLSRKNSGGSVCDESEGSNLAISLADRGVKGFDRITSLSSVDEEGECSTVDISPSIHDDLRRFDTTNSSFTAVDDWVDSSVVVSDHELESLRQEVRNLKIKLLVRDQELLVKDQELAEARRKLAAVGLS